MLETFFLETKGSEKAGGQMLNTLRDKFQNLYYSTLFLQCVSRLRQRRFLFVQVSLCLSERFVLDTSPLRPGKIRSIDTQSHRKLRNYFYRA